jgi:type III secretory pathway component EscV
MKIVKKFDLQDLIIGVIGAVSGLLIYFVVIPKTIHVRHSVLVATTYFSDSAFVPKIWSALIFFFSLGIIYESLSKGDQVKSLEDQIDKQALKETTVYVLGILLVSSAFVALLPRLGYRICSMLLLGICMWIYGCRSLPVLGTFSIIIPLALHVLFKQYLYVIFP